MFFFWLNISDAGVFGSCHYFSVMINDELTSMVHVSIKSQLVLLVTVLTKKWIGIHCQGHNTRYEFVL